MPASVGSPLVGPQGDGQTARRVGAEHHVVVPVATGDPVPRRVELLEVVRDVLDVARGVVLAQGPAVLAQVEGVEVVAAVVPPLGVLGVEEVVAEPVHVQHRPTGRSAPARSRTRFASTAPSRRAEDDRLHGVRRAEDVDVDGSMGRQCRQPEGVEARGAPPAAQTSQQRELGADLGVPLHGRRRTGLRALSIASSGAVRGVRRRDEAGVLAHRLVVVAVHAEPGPEQAADPGPRRPVDTVDLAEHRPAGGVLVVADQVGGVLVQGAAGRGPPSAACPRHTPSTGRPRRSAASSSASSQASRSGPPAGGARVRLRAVPGRVDVGAAADHQAVEPGHDRVRQRRVGRGRRQQHRGRRPRRPPCRRTRCAAGRRAAPTPPRRRAPGRWSGR